MSEGPDLKIYAATGSLLSDNQHHLGQQLQADAPPHITLHSSARLTRTGLAVRLVQDNGATALKDSADPALLRLIIRARGWWAILREGEITPTTLAAQEGVTVSYLQRVLRLAFLAPSVIEAMLDGKLRAGVDTAYLYAPDAIAPHWQKQAERLLPDSIRRD